MKKVLRGVSNLLEILTIISFLVLASLIIFQIAGRWTGIKGIGWTDEMISCFTTWMVFLGLAYLCELDGHIQITMLQDVLPAWAKRTMMITVRLVNIGCGLAITYSGLSWTRSTATKITPSLQIHYNIWYNAVWICGAFFTLFALVKLFETIALLNPEKTNPTV